RSHREILPRNLIYQRDPVKMILPTRMAIPSLVHGRCHHHQRILTMPFLILVRCCGEPNIRTMPLSPVLLGTYSPCSRLNLNISVRLKASKHSETARPISKTSFGSLGK